MKIAFIQVKIKRQHSLTRRGDTVLRRKTRNSLETQLTSQQERVIAKTNSIINLYIYISLLISTAGHLLYIYPFQGVVYKGLIVAVVVSFIAIYLGFAALRLIRQTQEKGIVSAIVCIIAGLLTLGLYIYGYVASLPDCSSSYLIYV